MDNIIKSHTKASLLRKDGSVGIPTFTYFTEPNIARVSQYATIDASAVNLTACAQSCNTDITCDGFQFQAGNKCYKQTSSNADITPTQGALTYIRGMVDAISEWASSFTREPGERGFKRTATKIQKIATELSACGSECVKKVDCIGFMMDAMGGVRNAGFIVQEIYGGG